MHHDHPDRYSGWTYWFSFYLRRARIRRGEASQRLAEMYSLDMARTLSELKPESRWNISCWLLGCACSPSRSGC